MRLVFLGPPGVGKGTQARRLCEARGLPHIATGDMLREAVRRGTPPGRRAQARMDAGKLVADEVVVAIIEKRFAQPDVAEGYVLDGFPRTLPQAEALDGLLRRRSETLSKVLYFDAPDEALVERISGRRTCRGCQANYHARFLAPREPGLCNRCGGKLFQRDDDREETVRERLRVYRAQTGGLIPFYSERGILIRVDAAPRPDDVAAEVRRALG